MPAIDLLGQTFGRLTVIADGGSDKDANKLWHCRVIAEAIRCLAGPVCALEHRSLYRCPRLR